MSSCKINFVKQWFETKYSEWLKQNSVYKLNKITHSADKLLLEFESIEEENFSIEISSDDIDEISLISGEIKNKKVITRVISNTLDRIYNLEENKIFTSVLADVPNNIIPQDKTKIRFICNTENEISFESVVQNTISLRMLYILIEENEKLKFVPKDSEGNFKTDLVSCFTNFSYLMLDLTKYKSNAKDEEKINLIINAVFFYNEILNNLIIPEGLVNSSILKYPLKLENEEEIESAEPKKVPFYHYDTEAIIYFLVSSIHDDFRFKYLDLYHVLEYYFDRSALYSIKNLIKDELGNPLIYFEDSETFRLAKKLKETISSDKTKYKEQHSLYLVLKLITVEKIVLNIGQLQNNEYKIELPIIKSENSTRLKQIVVNCNKNGKKYKLNNLETSEEKILETMRDRIYEIRNAIAHSKEEFSWRLKPNSQEIRDLEKKDLKLIKFLSMEIMKYFKGV